MAPQLLMAPWLPTAAPHPPHHTAVRPGGAALTFSPLSSLSLKNQSDCQGRQERRYGPARSGGCPVPHAWGVDQPPPPARPPTHHCHLRAG